MTQDILPIIRSSHKIFLSGPFGSGKTQLAIERISWLLRQERIRGDDLLVLVPQRTLAARYYASLSQYAFPPGPPVRVTTLAGLARSAVQLYWPLVAEQSGFDNPVGEPTFLNLETSQYHMAQFVEHAVQEGEFDGVHIERSRIVSQVLDNMNKASLNGLTIEEVYRRLELAVPAGDQRTARINALRAAQRISLLFRQLCIHSRFVDFSLLINMFNNAVMTNDWSRTHLFRSCRHLIFDNAEEDTHSAHQLVTEWMPHLDSSLIIADDDGGYRVFLGAAPQNLKKLQECSEQQLALDGSYVASPALLRISQRVDEIILRSVGAPFELNNGTNSPVEHPAGNNLDENLPLRFPASELRFYPQMIDWVSQEIRSLIDEEGVPPGEIAVLAPYVSDALRFSLQNSLAQHGIRSTTHRPSRALQDEPAARCLLTWAKLAHPDWAIRPPPADVAMSLILSIANMDPVRANLLGQIIFPPRRATIELGTFGALLPAMQERITFAIGEAYDHLRDWVYAYRSASSVLPLDQFLARLFGEVLSQPGYGFHHDFDSARIANQLVVSSRNFRWSLESTPLESKVQGSTLLGREYVQLVESGALGALYVPGWRESENAVFIAPAYTFLMRNRPVGVQFWLDIGSSGWWERLYQPLTHPHVVAHDWPANRLWADRDEYSTRQETMRRLLVGLIRRASKRIYLGVSVYSESGFEQRGPLLSLVNRLLAT